MTFLEMVRDAYTSSGMKAIYVAKKIGIKPDAFYDILKGLRKMESKEFLRFCLLINKNPADFLGGEDVGA